MSSSSFSRKKLHLRHPAVVDVGCNCRPKFTFSSFTSFFSSSSSSSSSSNSSSRYSKATKSVATSSTTNITAASSSWDPMTAATSHYGVSTPSPPLLPRSGEETTAPRRRRRRRRRRKALAAERDEEGRVARESVAVVKETTDPYVAFKESMVQMIVEKEIYGWDDLNDLLRRFLSLNSPRHHHLILHAFTDIWDGTANAGASSSAVPLEDHAYAPLADAAPPSPYNYHYYY